VGLVSAVDPSQIHEMKSPSLLLGFALAFAGCASNAAAPREAHEARYHGERMQLMQAVIDAIGQKGVISADPATGIVRTRDSSCDANGEPGRGVGAGGGKTTSFILYRHDIGLRADGTAYRLEIHPVVGEWREGYSEPLPIADADVPGCVQLRTEKLTNRLREALNGYEVATVPTK
jgi:hypothetical protein